MCRGGSINLCPRMIYFATFVALSHHLSVLETEQLNAKHCQEKISISNKWSKGPIILLMNFYFSRILCIN